MTKTIQFLQELIGAIGESAREPVGVVSEPMTMDPGCPRCQKPDRWFRAEPAVNDYAQVVKFHVVSDVNGEFLLLGGGGPLAWTQSNRSNIHVFVADHSDWEGRESQSPSAAYEELRRAVHDMNEGHNPGDVEFEVEREHQYRLAILAFASWVSWNVEGESWSRSRVTVG